MKTDGLQEAAAKNYNIHWSADEADKVRKDLLATYVELDLWHAWTELTPDLEVSMPDPDRGGKISRQQVHFSKTLGNRQIVCTGLNAALAYQDQSTGADIMGTVMDVLGKQHPDVGSTLINQVHDEILFEIPVEKALEYVPIIEKVMNDIAEQFLMPYGVHAECSPAVGETWLKEMPNNADGKTMTLEEVVAEVQAKMATNAAISSARAPSTSMPVP